MQWVVNSVNRIHIFENFVCRDLLNPMLISMNLFIKAPLIGVMNFNSYVFKTKIHFKKTFSKVAYQIKYGSIVFLENWSFILKGANVNFKHKFKNWFCYERDIKIFFSKNINTYRFLELDHQKDCKYHEKKRKKRIKTNQIFMNQH